jgi:hypothetical protein
MRRFKEFFSKYKWPILLGVITGFLLLIPTLYSVYRAGPSGFKGVFPLVIDDEEYYLARTQDVVDGHANLGSTYLKEHKADPYMAPSLGENIFGKIAKYFNIPVPLIFVINSFILALAGTIIFYILIFSITGSGSISLLMTFAYNIFFLRELSRPIHPQFSVLFLYLGMLVIWKIYTQISSTKKIIFYSAILGLIFGFSIYTYPYFWSTIVAVYGAVMLAILMLKKDIKPVMKSLVPFSIAAAIIAIPYLLNYLKISASPYYLQSLGRMGLISTFFPGSYYNAALVIFTLIFLILIRKKIINKNELVFSFVLLAIALLLNWQNLITGKYLFFSGHYNQALFILIIIVYALILKNFGRKIEFADKSNLMKKISILTVIILFFSFVAYKKRNDIFSVFSYKNALTQTKRLQKISQAFSWLNNNTEPDSVIYMLGTSDDRLISVYTKNNLYFYGYAGLTLMSNDELEDRWVRQHIFNKNIDEDYIIRNNVSIWHLKYLATYQNKEVKRKMREFITGKKEDETVRVPSDSVQRVLEKYKNIKKQDPREALKKYQIDYIIIAASDENSNGEGYDFLLEDIKKYDFIKPMTVINNYHIYKVL